MEKTAIPHKIQISNGKTSIVTNQIPDDSKGFTHIPNRSPNVLGSHGTTYIAGNGIVTEEENTRGSIHQLLEIGETVFNRYIIRQQIKKSVGAEAQIYLAENSNRTRVIVKAYTYNKQFQRVYDILKSLNHPNVARLYEYGTHISKLTAEVVPVEVVEYFDGGSLEGRKLSLDKLRRIVGQINEGLNEFHRHYIYANDLKPSNVVTDSSGRVAIIDFSLCTMESPHANNGKGLEQGQGTLIEDNLLGNLTPGYSSPEFAAFGLSSRNSDYFSLGVSIFEFFFGFAPFKGMNMREWELHISANANILPVNAPRELEIINHLIVYNPLSRVGYDEVRKFCNGEHITFAASNAKPNAEFVYIIQGETATNRQSLRALLVKYWGEGLNRFLHNDIYNSFVSAQGGNQDIAAICKRITDAYSSHRKEEGELAYLEFLYRLFPDDKRFVWRGRVFENTEAVSDYILTSLRIGSGKETTILIHLGVLSVYFTAIGMPNQSRTFLALETAYKRATENRLSNPFADPLDEPVNFESLQFAYGFILSKCKKLMIRDQLFNEEHIAANIDSFVNDLTNKNGYPRPEFGGYLIAIGKLRLDGLV